MSGFKLLALRPLANCDRKYRKILDENTFYKFYNDYTFHTLDDGVEVKDGKGPIQRIEHTPTSPADLYNIKQRGKKDLTINISAVVGKNGSGKSTLTELLFSTIYLLSIESGLINLDEELQQIETTISNLNTDISQLNKELSSMDLSNDDPELSRFRLKVMEHERLSEDLRQQEERKQLYSISLKEPFPKGLDLELYFSIDENYYIVKTDEKSLRKTAIGNINVFKPTVHNFQQFFYNVALNYSLYGLNSRDMGPWIEKLFHKNDGYKAPIVINPMRTEGDIDINTETHLNQSRILTNLIDSKLRQKKTIEDKEVSELRFLVWEDKLKEFDYFFEGVSYESSFYGKSEGIRIRRSAPDDYTSLFPDLSINKNILDYFFTDQNLLWSLTGLEIEQLKKYIFQKLFKIVTTYTRYKKYYSADKPKSDTIVHFERMVEELKTDTSHTTLKLRQVLNTIRYGILSNGRDFKKPTEKIEWKNNSINLPFEEYSFRINTAFKRANDDFSKEKYITNKKPELIEFVPNAYFIPEIRFKDEAEFTSLSSGEQQFINSINTVIYHLLNIDSIPKHYTSIQLVFDEIELYFHPDYQRKFISELLKAIGNLKFSSIKTINILFSTHSPFILSDIPSSNILRLERGKIQPAGNETFGSNIHTLLKDSFFLDKSFIGDFAKQEIQTVIDTVRSKPTTKKLNSNQVEERIGIIGEPLLKSEILRLSLKKLDKQAKIDYHLNEIKKIEEQ